MKTNIFLFFAIFFPFFLTAQLQDDFSDGDFSTSPTWNGDIDKFTVTDGELQLLDTNPGTSNTSYLYTNALTSLSETTTWEFSFRMNFAPSASNFGRIYLIASNTDLTSNQNGYYLKLGGISGSEDAIELYRQDGMTSTLLLSGTSGSLGNNPALARVRIIRSPDGLWQLFADYSGGTTYVLDGTTTDATYDLGNYIGYYCKYTSTRSEHFFLDDVLVTPLFEDITAPVLESVLVNSATEIVVNFNEPLDPTTLIPDNFSLNQGIGAPITIMPQGGSPNSAILTLPLPLSNLSEYIVTTNNVADTQGNAAGLQSKSFTFYDIQIPEENELLITELLPDPSPVIGLPQAEYIELYNPSGKVISLANISLKVNTSTISLPHYLLLPGKYLTLCQDDYVSDFEHFGDVLGLESFPSLINSGANIQLMNEEMSTIFEIDYDSSWYHDEDKDNGGWSIEMISLEGPYNCGGNWVASNNFTGGTPSAENSVNGAVIDILGPRVIAAIPLSAYELLVTFDEAFDEASATNIDHFSISNGLEIAAIFPQSSLNQLLLSFSTEMQTKTVYQLDISTSVLDCIGNHSPPGSKVFFGLPEEISPFDIQINEILFDPETGGHDFLELFNISDKIVNLKGLELFNAQKETGSNLAQIDQDYLFLPGQYAVITSAPSDLTERYSVLYPERIIKNSLPSLDNDQGNITLRNQNIMIDSFDYDKSFHFPLIDPEGVSLEKIDESLPSYITGNWHSASSLVGFATPTYKNSQFREPNNDPISNTLELLDKTFSPNGDGESDVLRIGYQTDKPGYFINLVIFDARGRLVKKVNKNSLIGTQGVLKWDGTNNDQEKVRLGIYIIWAEIFAPDGTVSYFKESCVVADLLGK